MHINVDEMIKIGKSTNTGIVYDFKDSKQIFIGPSKHDADCTLALEKIKELVMRKQVRQAKCYL